MDFLVNSETAGSQEMPGITALADGSFVVTWHDDGGTLGDGSGTSIKARLFDSSGVARGEEFVVNSATTGDQYSPSLTALADGGFVVTWRDASGAGGDASGTSIKARLFDSTGVATGPEVLVNSETAGYQVAPRITALLGGGFVVTWQDGSGTGGDASVTSIKARVYDATGSAPAGEILINGETLGGQYTPGITALADGGFVVSWEDTSGIGGDAAGSSIKARLFDSTGLAQDGELLVNSETAGFEFGPSLTALAQGGFVVTWYDLGGTLGDALGFSLKARVLDGAGVAQATEFLVNVEAAGDQTMPGVTALADGRFVVTWKDTSGLGGDASGSSIKARVFDGAGGAAGAEILVNEETAGDQSFAAITALANGGFVISWQDASGMGDDTSGTAIKASLFDASGTALAPATLHEGTAVRDMLAGTAGRDVMLGLGGRDRLAGLDGDDRLAGGAGNDRLIGGAGADVLFGGRGKDVFKGGAGVDMADFAGTARITADLAMAGFQITGQGSDKLLGIENLAGGSMNDVLKGTSGANLLIGRDGNDRLIGRGGADRLDGGAGADKLNGGKGADRLDGGTGADRLGGGPGGDVFVFASIDDNGSGAGLRDVISDFGTGADRIDLSAIDTNPVAVGNQGFTFIGDAAFSGNAAEVRSRTGARKTIVMADIDGDGTADFEIDLIGAHTLGAGDFLL